MSLAVDSTFLLSLVRIWNGIPCGNCKVRPGMGIGCVDTQIWRCVWYRGPANGEESHFHHILQTIPVSTLFWSNLPYHYEGETQERKHFAGTESPIMAVYCVTGTLGTVPGFINKLEANLLLFTLHAAPPRSWAVAGATRRWQCEAEVLWQAVVHHF